MPRAAFGRGVLRLEQLEAIEAAGSLLPLSWPLAGMALVAASPDEQSPAFERRDTSADDAANWQASTDQTLSDLVFSQPAAPDDTLALSQRFFAGANALPAEEEFARGHHFLDTSFDPLASAANALVDPLSDPATAHAPKTGAHDSGQPTNPMSNVNAPNLAGIGSGVGGVSTPAVQAGGGGGGAGGGNSAANLLNALGIQGAFAGLMAGAVNGTHAAPGPETPALAPAAPHIATAPLAGNRAAPPPPLSVANPGMIVRPARGPKIGDPPISASEGVPWSGAIATVTDSDNDGTTGPAEPVNITVNWGDGSSAAFTLQVPEGGTAGLDGGHTWTETGSYTVTITASDPDGGSSQASEIATVVDGSLTWSPGVNAPNNAPSWSQTFEAAPNITTPLNQGSAEGQAVSLPIQASDTDGDALSYDALGLPAGLSINQTTGLITGTVDYAAAEDFGGTYTPTIIVADGHGGSQQTSFTWTITDTPRAPTVTAPVNQSNAAGSTVSLQISANDPDGNTLSYDATGLPAALSIDPDTGLISGTIDPSAGSPTPYSVTVTATDEFSNLSASKTFTWTVTTANLPPALTSPGNQTNAAGDQVSLALSASDADADGLTYTATGLPAGLTIDPASGTISGTLSNSAASATPYSVTVTSSDGVASSSQTFTWTVNYVGLTNPGAQSNLDGDVVSLQLTGSDSAGLALTYTATNLPPGLSINSTTGLISGTIANTANNSTPYAVTVTATDSATHSASQSFNWSVARLALTNPGTQENQEGSAVSLQLSVTDVGGSPSYSATGLPTGLSVNATTGLISGTIGTAAHGSSPYQVTVTATDGTNSSSQAFVWTVTPRVALVNPGRQTNATGDIVSLQLSATSPSGVMTYSATGLPAGLSITSSTGLISGTIASTAASATPYSVTVTANDGTSSSSQTFLWNVSVIAIAPPGDQTNLDGDVVSLSLTTHYHGTGTLSYSASGLPTGLSISATTGQISGTVTSTADTSSPYQATVTATDGSNTTSQKFTWTIKQRVSIDPLSDQSNGVGAAVSVQVSAADANNATLSYSATGLPSGVTISSTTGLISGTIALGADTSSPYAVTVTVSDGTVSATQTFNWTVTHVSLINPGPQASVDGHVVSLQMQGKDADGDALTWTATGLPTGLSINSVTGLISGTLTTTADTNSRYDVTVTASDGLHNTSQTFVWTVTQVGITNPGVQTNTEGDTVLLQLQGLSSGGVLSYSASGLPTGLSLNPTTGLISGTIAAGAAANGPFTTTVAVSNGTTSFSQQFTWTINPVVTLTTIANQSNLEGNTVSLQVTATDSKHATLSYTAAGLPAGLSINSTTGLISGTVSAGDAANGPYVVTVTASDGTYSTSQMFNWTVTHTDTATPTMTLASTQDNVTSDRVNLAISASDPDGDALSYSATGLPDGLDIDTFSGVISGVIAEDAVSTTPYSVTVTADDRNGKTVSQTFSWIVNDALITPQAVPVSAVEGNDTGAITVATFTTPDLNKQASDFTAEVNWGDGTTTDTASVTGGSGSFTVTGNHKYAEKGTFTVSVTISDGAGSSVTATGTATVADAALTLTGGFQFGDAMTNQPTSYNLAYFTDADPGAPITDYTSVTINWGDGTTTLGNYNNLLRSVGNGVYAIVASHTYANPFPSAGPVKYTVTVTLTDVDGASAQTTDTVEVGNIVPGVPATMSNWIFQDQSTVATAADFVSGLQTGVASINWGDGTTSLGTVTQTGGGSGLPVQFSVSGTHTYTQDSIGQINGQYVITVTVTDDDGNTLTGTQYASVVRPPMTLNAGTVEALAGLTLSSVEVASFTVPDITDASGEFSAAINWGDGTPADNTAVITGSSGLFHVLGTHTYAADGQYVVSATVSQGWNAMLPLAAAITEAETPADRFSISGPRFVPGNSMYTFQIYNPRLTSDHDELTSFTMTGAKGRTFAYPAKPSGVKNRLAVNIYFDNQPAQMALTAKFKSGATATGEVSVIQVNVTDPKGGSFTTGTPSDIPDPVKVTPNLTFPYSMKGLRSATGVNQAGFAWKANVELMPKGSIGLKHIEVGFIQHIYVQRYYGFYGAQPPKGGFLRSEMEDHTYVDVGTAPGVPTRDPFYSIITPDMKLPPSFVVPAGVTRQTIFTGSSTRNSATIGFLIRRWPSYPGCGTIRRTKI